ncbi:hypothetical protein PLICRDRAFT_177391 [Plicaturopsis crispa FD-325 SS-3]|nr:hypothetical protein PLICRDRAFT_177391 [Plicaturopsis crispa FD-325 SS-3]
MSEFHSTTGTLPSIPDDLTLAQFFLDEHHPTRPMRNGSIPWMIDDDTGRKIGFEELRARTSGLANALKVKFNIQENDAVLIFSPNHVDYPVAIWAAHRLGAVVSGANPTYTTSELSYQAEATHAVLTFTVPAALPVVLSAGIPPDRIVLFDVPAVALDNASPKPPLARTAHEKHPTVNDLVAYGLSQPTSFVERRLAPGEAKTKLAFLSFSSGTTGRPKAVAIPHYSPIANIIQMAVHNKVNTNYAPWEEQRYRPGDVVLSVLPFFHIYGLVVILHNMIYCAMTLVVVPKFNFTKMLQSIERYRINFLPLVPPQAVLLCKHPDANKYDLSSVRVAMFGAAPLTGEVYELLRKKFPHAHLGQGYGLTETCTTVCMMPVSKKHATVGSAGQIIPGTVVRVVKPDGSLAGVDEPGELVVRGPSMALGYANNAEATKETFVDGWVKTGDEVIINRDGDLFIVDRLKEIMKVRGFQVAPAELEGFLLGHPDVADTCVVGVPDDYSGEVPLAFVVLNAQAAQRVRVSPAEADNIKKALMKYVEDNKVAYKRLAGGVEFVDTIPKNPSGKLLRRVLREQAKALRVKTKAKL